jgi:predicted Zn-dependent protease with MMP-like domain
MTSIKGNPIGWRPRDAMETKRRRRFEHIVEDCLNRLPRTLRELLDNVVFETEDEPAGSEDLLGQYIGIPRTQRTEYNMALPDRIILYRRPLERAAGSAEELRRETFRTIVHEIAHHLGMDEEEILQFLGEEYI